MTTNTDIVNNALQCVGTRTTVTDAELVANSSNEAIQANLIMTKLRDELLRMAPWDCGLNTANLTYITSVPGTPENTSAGTTLWQKGQPTPGWSYEYQYPVDCLRACFIIPSFQTGFSGGVPITTAVTGGAPAWCQGPPQRFKVSIDQFYPVTAATVASGGTGYAVGDIVTLASGPVSSAPIGAPVSLLVLTAPAGVIATVSVINQISGSASAQGGSYFSVQTNPVAAGSVLGVGGSTSAGTGATFTLTFGAQGSQRVILTNQEFATLVYVKQITDPNVMDPLFQDAWANILGARLGMALSGDKTLVKLCTEQANNLIMEARKADGNEGLTVNNVTPDWIRGRGIDFSDGYLAGPYSNFDWGNVFPIY